MSRLSMHSTLSIPSISLRLSLSAPFPPCLLGYLCECLHACTCLNGESGVGLGGNVIRLERLILLRWECNGRYGEGSGGKSDGQQRGGRKAKRGEQVTYGLWFLLHLSAFLSHSNLLLSYVYQSLHLLSHMFAHLLFLFSKHKKVVSCFFSLEKFLHCKVNSIHLSKQKM